MSKEEGCRAPAVPGITNTVGNGSSQRGIFESFLPQLTLAPN